MRRSSLIWGVAAEAETWSRPCPSSLLVLLLASSLRLQIQDSSWSHVVAENARNLSILTSLPLFKEGTVFHSLSDMLPVSCFSIDDQGQLFTVPERDELAVVIEKDK